MYGSPATVELHAEPRRNSERFERLSEDQAKLMAGKIIYCGCILLSGFFFIAASGFEPSSELSVSQILTAKYAQARRLLVIAGPRIRGIPFVHLTAGGAAHGKRNARKAFEQNPLSLETG